MAQNNIPEEDPLEGFDKRPAVSWKGAAVGTIKTLTVESYSRSAQTTVFGSNPPKLAFWPGNTPGEQGNPKMAVVFDVLEEGEERSLWAPIPSSLKTALMKAQQEAGQRIGPGGTLELKLTRQEDKGKGNPQNIFAARYTPPVAQPPADALGGAAPAGHESDPWGSSSTPAGEEPPF